MKKAVITKAASKNADNDDKSISSVIFREGFVLLMVLLSVYLFLALATFSPDDAGWTYTGKSTVISNWTGRTGAWISDVFYNLFGYAAFLFPLILAQKSVQVFREGVQFDQLNYPVIVLRFVGFIFFLVSATGLLGLHISSGSDLPASSGGIVGYETAKFFVSAFNVFGGSLILFTVAIISLTVATNLSWVDAIEKLGRSSIRAFDFVQTKFNQTLKSFSERKAAKEKKEEREKIFEVGQKNVSERKPPTISKPKPKPVQSKRVEKEKQQSLFGTIGEGTLPALNLLDEKLDSEKRGFSSEALEGMSRLLEIKLKDFNIDAEVTAVQPGPVVTRFEIQPAAGIKVSKITGLAKDIARSLAVISVRVVEVIPGKTVVGIEIPNEIREMIKFSEIINSTEYDDSKSPLTLALGKDIAGVPIIADLAKMPHLLVAGTTGSGKSVGVNAMILSMLFKAGPDELRLILIDPKMLELSVYDGIPHLLTPVVTDMKDAANALRWCVAEMERRYKLMAAVGVRNLNGYNKKVKDAKDQGEPLLDPIWVNDGFDEDATAPELEHLPMVVVVIDEFADMMMIVGKKVEELIARIAQKARAAGIHLILATQRPSVDVITGLIKANVPSRMAFQVSSKVDSRTILDQGGAEQLLGHGDMLFLPPGTSLPERVHGAFVADEEVHRVCDDWRTRATPNYLEEILDGGGNGISETGMVVSETEDDAEQDPLYDQAVAFVLETRRVSISSVQRKMRIGYNRAARLVESMEAAGVVSEMQSNGSREVLAPSPNHE